MSNKPRAFIVKPLFTNFHNTKLKYLDVLTFVAIRSFNNKSNNDCYPSQQTIASLSGLSERFVTKSIARLEEEKHLYVYRSGRYTAPNKSESNRYTFPHCDQFDQVPYELFKTKDLTVYERAMLLLIKQFNVSPVDVYGTINDFSDILGLTYSTISTQYKSLCLKGYLDGSRLKKKRTQLLKIDWAFPEYLKINKIQKPIIHLTIT
ncbi:helix-turn-helix domain-containing protein [Pedobacter gandavensis]|uniref:Helix-turn-helix domain-containing protein n=1 Tax=Pedobacter gandavensis TaxID=2679963 RepID=A0ABR6F2E2_9SPHI|nr:helix-turn-helix domain-containing protein [Pedobacter gandavensis]MBB2151710.1 hypothetical protein [Pedobacter gandavensis]